MTKNLFNYKLIIASGEDYIEETRRKVFAWTSSVTKLLFLARQNAV